MYIDIHAQCPLFLSDFNETDFRKIFKYQISSKSFQRESNYSMRLDRRKDVMKLIVAFRTFAKVPNKSDSQHSAKLSSVRRKVPDLGGLDWYSLFLIVILYRQLMDPRSSSCHTA